MKLLERVLPRYQFLVRAIPITIQQQPIIVIFKAGGLKIIETRAALGYNTEVIFAKEFGLSLIRFAQLGFPFLIVTSPLLACRHIVLIIRKV